LAVAAPPAICSRCNVPNQLGSLFCNNCRLYLRDETQSVERATYTRRFFGSWLLDGILMIVTLVIGWFIWLIFTARTGQTPSKRLTNLYVINVASGRSIGTGDTWIREVIVKILVIGALSTVTGLAWLIDAVWLFFDKNRQTLHDKVLGQIVVYAPAGLPESVQYQANAPALYQAPPVIPDHFTGTAQTAATKVTDVAEELRELARLRDEGIITPDEYETKRSRLVDRM
jgi:uncharacterized RDD family membrane protein YckC